MGAKDSKKEKKEILFQQESLDLLTQCSSKRMKVKEICKALEIPASTFHRMYTDYPEFKYAYYKGIQSRVIDCIDSLERMCTGYYIEEEKITSMGDIQIDGGERPVVIKNDLNE